MPNIRILSQPRLHPENGGFYLLVDCTVLDDDGTEVPGFHKDVKIDPNNLPELLTQPDLPSAFAYIVSRMAAIDPAYSQERLVAAITAIRLNQALMAAAIAEGVSFPVDVPVGEIATSEQEARWLTQPS